jgi:hypothetical protein
MVQGDATGHAFIEQCWRGEIKFGIDAEAATLDPSTPRDTTISNLIAQPAPRGLSQHGRVKDVETTVWRVQAVLKGHKWEANDSDFHLAISDPDNPQAKMVAEIPDPKYLQPTDPFFNQISAARQAAQARLHFHKPAAAGLTELAISGAPLALTTDPDIGVTITGIGFFDRSHSVLDAAPNRVELHPVLKVEFS